MQGTIEGSDDDRGAQPISPAEENLAELSARHLPDSFLFEMLRLAERGMGLGIGLLLNGMVVTGQLIGAEAVADEIDTERRSWASRAEPPEDRTPDEWAEDVERFASRARRLVEERRAWDEQLQKDAEPFDGGEGIDTAAAPASVARRLILAETRSHLTLQNVRLVAPAQPGVTKLPVLRVQLSQVAGWWPLRTDGDGQTRITMWEQ